MYPTMEQSQRTMADAESAISSGDAVAADCGFHCLALLDELLSLRAEREKSDESWKPGELFSMS